ncbi:MAG: hypothetical protein KBD06_00880 [Candidatus Pacebacteria bacterium]|nr:hypothetical protein [Candidatus Paceibacterota bacterium]
MTNNKLKLVGELPHPEYGLVQLVQQRLGLIASTSLICFLFGEITHLAGISPTEVDVIECYALEMNVTLPEGRLPPSAYSSRYG